MHKFLTAILISSLFIPQTVMAQGYSQQYINNVVLTSAMVNQKESEVYFQSGIAKGKINDYDGAVKDFSKTLAINKTDTDAYFLRGISYLFADNQKLALQDLEQAKTLSLDKENYKMYEGIMEFIKIVKEN